MLLDIVILPPKNLRKKMGEKIKKVIGKSPNFFVVDNKKLIPHLSLWHLKTSKKRLSEIAYKLESLVRSHKPIRIVSSRFRDIPKYNGCFEFPVENNSSMIALQEKVFKSICKYKTGTMPKFAPFLKIKYSKEKLNDIKKYGRPLGFHPHFTMGWLKNKEDTPRVVKAMSKTKFSFLAKEVYICEVDKWWQVKRIIKKIEFGL